MKTKEKKYQRMSRKRQEISKFYAINKELLEKEIVEN